MVTRIRKHARGHIYLAEWIKARGTTYQRVGDLLGVDRSTVWRWNKEQWRLDAPKIAEIADKLGIEPEQLYRLPTERQSIDALLKDASDADYDTAAELARRLARRAS